jgi:hypothetical protein
VPLSTLAVPSTTTGELIELPPSGLSMMIRSPLGMGDAGVPGEAPAELLGLAVSLGEAEELGVGVLLWNTKVVVLSPPQAAIMRPAAQISTNRDALFIHPSFDRVKATPT